MGHHLGLEERPTFLCKLQPEQNMGSLRKKGVQLKGRKLTVSVTEATCPSPPGSFRSVVLMPHDILGTQEFPARLGALCLGSRLPERIQQPPLDFSQGADRELVTVSKDYGD